MDKKEFLSGLGLAPAEAKVTEIVVPEDKVEKVADKPSSNEEIDRLKSKLSELEESQQRDGQDVREQLNSVSNVVSELRGEVKSSPAVVQSGLLLETLEEVQNRLSRLETAFKVSACPKCGTLGYGSNIQEVPEDEFNEKTGKPSKYPLKFALFPNKMVRCRECPNPECGYVEEAKKEE